MDVDEGVGLFVKKCKNKMCGGTHLEMPSYVVFNADHDGSGRVLRLCVGAEEIEIQDCKNLKIFPYK